MIGGFSYEDRGRAGMVAARDPLMAHIAEEAARGKAVIGNCNGAQILVESGLIPLDQGLKMSLARNVIDGQAAGFLSEWVWIKPLSPGRCATDNWQGTMHLQIAHGEGRFVTKDKDIVAALKANNQIAFTYCREDGSEDAADPIVTPNGAIFGIAGICNPAGNVVALMPHPERTENGGPYFASLKAWIESHPPAGGSVITSGPIVKKSLPERGPSGHCEIFIDTIIVNNEERTVEQAARRLVPSLGLRQLRYISTPSDPASVLTQIAVFNPNKEIAFIRRGNAFTRWNSDEKNEETVEPIIEDAHLALLRRDEPDTGAASFGKNAETGTCYVCSNIQSSDAERSDVQEIFRNPHASVLERLVS